MDKTADLQIGKKLIPNIVIITDNFVTIYNNRSFQLY